MKAETRNVAPSAASSTSHLPALQTREVETMRKLSVLHGSRGVGRVRVRLRRVGSGCGRLRQVELTVEQVDQANGSASLQCRGEEALESVRIGAGDESTSRGEAPPARRRRSGAPEGRARSRDGREKRLDDGFVLLGLAGAGGVDEPPAGSEPPLPRSRAAAAVAPQRGARRLRNAASGCRRLGGWCRGRCTARRRARDRRLPGTARRPRDRA